MSFNQKYQRYVEQLPKYVLSKIRIKILEKYQINDTNPEIDQIFEKALLSYKKKRQYDKKYFSGQQKSNDSELAEKLQKANKQNEEYREYLSRFVEYHKINNLPPAKTPIKKN
jgi:hypothetical protein